MPDRIVIIGADAPALNGVLAYLEAYPDTEAIALYPELNPLSEFTCGALGKFLGRGIEFPEENRASSVDIENKRVMVRDIYTGAEQYLTYDKLIFASGATPDELGVPGEHLASIQRIGNFDDAKRLTLTEGKTVVIGNSHNLLLTAAMLMHRGQKELEIIPVPVSQSASVLSDDLDAMVMHHLAKQGVTVHTDASLISFEADGQATKIITSKAEIRADRIINATASTSVTYLAKDAGLTTDESGAILVDETLQTSAEDILACGGCAAFRSSACKKPIPGSAIRSTESRQAAALAMTLSGQKASFLAPVSAFSVVLGDLTVAGAGLNVEAAKLCGFTPMSATVIQFDRAHFMPEAELMTLELVFDAPSRRVVGIQGLGKSGQGLCGRVSAISALLATHPTIEDVSNLEVAYSPPFAQAMDIINTVANVADNMLAGTNEGMGADEFQRVWNDRENGEHFFLDCRELGNAQPFLDRHPAHWNHIPQGEIARRLDEIPKDKRIILLCNTGARSYEAQVTLKHAGYSDVTNVDGGVSAIKQSGGEI